MSAAIARPCLTPAVQSIDGHPIENRADRLLAVRAGRDLHYALRGQRVGPFAVLRDPVIALEIQAGDVVV